LFPFLACSPPRVLHSFPTRRSSDLGFRPGSSCRATKRSTADSVDDDRRTLAGPRCACLENDMVLAVRGIFVNESNGRRPMKNVRSEEHTSELQSLRHLVCRLLLEKK